MKIIAVSHDITFPRDAASGLPSGSVMHKPIIITKTLDKSRRYFTMHFAVMSK
ncbi:type VI secretion system tube protein Hcp [Chryseobacterium sp. Leaf394]|uniref:type VI secretion system tube protein Hcp n=1 Tax=Chryseobacterium sp. Leaf394 TaxID=1736361 RepID=UPI0009EAB061|nr:type VI secretion system tube protein Hcp [Chryseobacterium sp. Leaf394]